MATARHSEMVRNAADFRPGQQVVIMTKGAAGRGATTVRRGRFLRRRGWIVRLDEPTVGVEETWLPAHVLYFRDDFEDA